MMRRIVRVAVVLSACALTVVAAHGDAAVELIDAARLDSMAGSGFGTCDVQNIISCEANNNFTNTVQCPQCPTTSGECCRCQNSHLCGKCACKANWDWCTATEGDTCLCSFMQWGTCAGSACVNVGPSSSQKCATIFATCCTTGGIT